MKDLYVVLKRDETVMFQESFDKALGSAKERIDNHSPGVVFYVFKCLGTAQMPAGPVFTPIADYEPAGILIAGIND